MAIGMMTRSAALIKFAAEQSAIVLGAFVNWTDILSQIATGLANENMIVLEYLFPGFLGDLMDGALVSS